MEGIWCVNTDITINYKAYIYITELFIIIYKKVTDEYIPLFVDHYRRVKYTSLKWLE